MIKDVECLFISLMIDKHSEVLISILLTESSNNIINQHFEEHKIIYILTF